MAQFKIFVLTDATDEVALVSVDELENADAAHELCRSLEDYNDNAVYFFEEVK